MIFHWRKFHIGAVSLIEIMMIFFIIGIVSVAGMSLNKPKNQYLKKIAVYSAFINLQNAVLNIASEGHIGFTTEINDGCFNEPLTADDNSARISDYICPRYAGKYPGINTQLPAVVARKTLGTNAEVDPGLEYTAYNNLTTAKQTKYKYMQSGFCQRLASVFKLEDHNIACANNITGSTLIDDSANIPASFSSYTPQLYLPNGHVVYMSRYLYTKFNGTTYKVYTDPLEGDNYEESEYFEHNITTETITGFFSSISGIENMGGLVFLLPNEARLRMAGLSKEITDNDATKFAIDMWSNSKDYFNVYIDINGKMLNSKDTANGPDRLNSDVFLFHVYRDGAVRPAYETGFPLDYLTAKIMIKEQNSNRYQIPDPKPLYAMRPFVYASCLANTAGAYSKYANGTDYTGICGTVTPITSCTEQTDSANCRVFVNKPSFITKKMN